MQFLPIRQCVFFVWVGGFQIAQSLLINKRYWIFRKSNILKTKASAYKVKNALRPFWANFGYLSSGHTARQGLWTWNRLTRTRRILFISQL